MKQSLRALARGALKRCARCGQGRLFRRWFTLAERCPRCGLRFEREEGFWVGALIVSFTVTALAFIATIAIGLAITWPEVPVLPLTLACVAVMIAVPIVFYPWTKTIWIAIDLLMHRVDPQDRSSGGNGQGRAEILDRPPGR